MIGTRYVLDNGLWVPNYTVGRGLGDWVARKLYKLGFKQEPGCACPARQRWLNGRRRGSPYPIAGGAPGIIFEDEFISDADVLLRWPDNVNYGPGPGAMFVQNSVFHSGNSALKVVFPQPDGGGGVDIVRTLNSTVNPNPVGNLDEIYTRMWFRTENWTGGNSGQVGKVFFQYTNGGDYPNFWLVSSVNSPFDLWLGGQATNDVNCQSFAWPSDTYIDGCNYYSNRGNPGISDNTWFCIETHIKMNTPGQNNGILEVWKDESLTSSYTAQRFRPLNRVDLHNGTFSGPSANFNHVQIYRQHGTGARYFDQFAVSTTRIGCSGTVIPPPPPPPPVNSGGGIGFAGQVISGGR